MVTILSVNEQCASARIRLNIFIIFIHPLTATVEVKSSSLCSTRTQLLLELWPESSPTLSGLVRAVHFRVLALCNLFQVCLWSEYIIIALLFPCSANTRVIKQSSLQKFQEEMNAVKKDPYRVVMRQSKLPMSLLRDRIKAHVSMRRLCLFMYTEIVIECF